MFAKKEEGLWESTSESGRLFQFLMARTGKECRKADVRQTGILRERLFVRRASLVLRVNSDAGGILVLPVRIVWYIARSMWSRLTFSDGMLKSLSR